MDPVVELIGVSRRYGASGPLALEDVSFAYLRYGLSYRDVEELLSERGVVVDHVTVYRWVQRFTPVFAAPMRADTCFGAAGTQQSPARARRWHRPIRS